MSAQRWSTLFLRVDERSSDSYIGRDDFFFSFSGRVFKFVQAKINFARFGFWFLLKFNSLPVLKEGKLHYQTAKGHKKVIDF